MFYIYKVKPVGNQVSFVQNRDVSLFGSVNGIIPQMLQEITPSKQREAYKWEIDLARDLPKIGIEQSSVVIDLKPNQEGKISLYEIKKIFGYSDCGWTPMMFYLQTLFVDEPGDDKMKKKFKVNVEDAENIFTFHHVPNGTVRNGKIVGKWTPPRPSSTNSALLWEDSIDYFIECRQKVNK